jgi:hypothetical protein
VSEASVRVVTIQDLEERSLERPDCVFTAIQRTPSTALVCPHSVLPRLRINFRVDKLIWSNLVDRFKSEKLRISAQDLLLIRANIFLSNTHLSRGKYLLLCISPD